MQRFLILLAVVAIGLAAQTDAQGMRGMRGGKRGGHKARISEALQLSDEQVAQIGALKEDHKAQRQAAREEGKAAFEAILTEEQLALGACPSNRFRGHGMPYCPSGGRPIIAKCTHPLSMSVVTRTRS